MPRLGKRLLLIAESIVPGSRVADIGTDHAVLPIHIITNGTASRVIASDIARKPLQKAEENVTRAGLSGVIELRLSDGLNNIHPLEVDTIVIAGMGGELIAEILSKAPWLKDRDYTLILQPMTKAEKLRRYLREQGLSFKSESAVYDAGRYFTVITLSTKGRCRTYPPFFDYTGLLSANREHDLRYLERTAYTLRVRAEDMPQELHGSAEYRELISAAEHIEGIIHSEENYGA